MLQRHRCTGPTHNPRYVSTRVLLDLCRSPRRFVPHTSIEGWRESMRRDVRVRAALLNPTRDEPRGG